MPDDVAAQLEPLFIVWVALLGACVGSFLNVCIFRMPRECMSVSQPKRSFCPRCGRKLRWTDNIPILAWLALRGRCAGCKIPISPRYPLVETLTMLVFGWIAYRLLPGQMASLATWGALGIHVTFASALIVVAGIDLDHRIIPDEISLSGLVLAPLLIALVPSALPYGPPDPSASLGFVHALIESPLHWWGLDGCAETLRGWADPTTPRSPHLLGFWGSLLGALLGASFMHGVAVLFGSVLGPNAMGFGDVKLAGMIGAVAGWQGLGVALAVALVTGSAVGLVYMLATGRSRPSQDDLGPQAPPFRRWLLTRLGARPDHLRTWPGTALLVRMATGEGSIPFGPFLAVGAAVAVFAPEASGFLA